MHLKEIMICSCLILERKKPNKLAYKFSNGLFFRAEQWRLGTKLTGINKKTLILRPKFVTYTEVCYGSCHLY